MNEAINDDAQGDAITGGDQKADAATNAATTASPAALSPATASIMQSTVPSIQHALYSRGEAHPKRPLFLCLHGWGSNEEDIAGIMQYIAPHNDWISLRALYELPNSPNRGVYTWFHSSVPTGEALDTDANAAANAIDAWVAEHVPQEREIVPLGFSQGGLLATHVLRVNPRRYRAAISLSGFLAPGTLPGDAELANWEIPVFYGYGREDSVIPKYEIYATTAWLEEHTWLTVKDYRHLDHAVSLDEFSDIRQWLQLLNIAPGIL